MVINDKLIPKIDEVEIRHYGRHPRIDKFFTKLLGYGKCYQAAWKVTAHIRKWWPVFANWTRGDCQFVGTYSNGITNAGKASMAGLVGNTGSITAFTVLAYGSGTTAFAATQTALVSEIARATATISRITTTVTNDTLQLTKSFSITATETAAEGGILNNATSGGTMLARVVFSPARSMGSGDTLAYTHKVQFA